MRFRYFLLPILIISLMIFIIDREKELVNKEIVSDTGVISYPFFDNGIIDSYISNYLDKYIKEDSDVLIDYDYYNEDNVYYLTFYRYIFNGNMISNDSDAFVIDISSDTISRIDSASYQYDFVTNREYDSDSKLIALTFDDGPSYNTNKVLDILNKYNVKATFFVLGSKIKGNEYILKKMVSSGMEIGNHTFNHLLLTKYSEDKIEEEISSTSELIFEVTGKYPSLLRPSYGSFNKKIKNVSNMPIIIWNVDTLDWKYHSSKKITNRVVNKVSDGDIVLMHDVYSATSNALDSIIPILIDRGYSFVTVSDLFYYKNISLEDGKVYGYAR